MCRAGEGEWEGEEERWRGNKKVSKGEEEGRE